MCRLILSSKLISGIIPLLLFTANAHSQSERANQTNTARKKTSSSTHVSSFTPVGTIAPDNVISVTFSNDIITSNQLNGGTMPEKPILFDPNIDGVFEWETTNKVKFTPRLQLPAGTQFSAKINPSLKDASKEKLSESQEYRFNTSALWLKSATQSSFTQDKQVNIKLSFSDRINPAELKKYLSVSAEGKTLKWWPSSDVASAQPQIVTESVNTTGSLKLKIAPGLAGVSGPLAIRNQVEMNVPLKLVLKVLELKPKWSKESAQLQLVFSTSINIEDCRGRVTVTPPVDLNFSGYGNEINVTGDFKPETRYTVNVKEGIRGTNGSVLLSQETLSAWIPTMRPFMDLVEAGGYLSTKSSMKLRVKSTGLESLKVTVRRVYDNNLVYQVMRGGDSYSARELGRTIQTKEFPIDKSTNQANITEIDLKALVGEKASGLFSFTVIGKKLKELDISSDEPYDYDNYDSYQLRSTTLITLSDIGIVAKKSEKQLVAWVASLDSATPLANLNVELYSSSNQLIKKTTSDASGIAILDDLDLDNDNLKPKVVIAKSESGDISYLDLSDTFSSREDMETKGRPYLTKGYEAFIASERGAYRPGENVHVFGYLRGVNAAPPTGAFPLEYVVIRPDGKQVGEPKTITPDSDGTLNFDLATTREMPTGYYQVKVQMPGTSNNKESENDEY